MPLQVPWTYNQPDIKTDPTWALGQGYTPTPPTNYPSVTPYEPSYGLSYGYAPPATVEQTAWQRWQPYLQGLGIRPLSSGYLTATSPYFRERMNPQSLLGMQDYYTGMNKSWTDYLDWTNMFMPKTPVMQQRRWMPWRWR